MGRTMDIISFDQSDLNALKQNVIKGLKKLQIDYDSNLEDYHEFLEQLTAIGGWTENQSTDEGYAERHAVQEQIVQSAKLRLDYQEAQIFYLKAFITFIFETDWLIKLKANILKEEVVNKIFETNNIKNGEYPFDDFYHPTKEMLSECISPQTNTWQAREILALLKHTKTNCLIFNIRHMFRRPLTVWGEFNSHNLRVIREYISELRYLDYLEEVVTLGMLDLELNGNFKAELNYMLNHDFGKDVGVEK